MFFFFTFGLSDKLPHAPYKGGSDGDADQDFAEDASQESQQGAGCGFECTAGAAVVQYLPHKGTEEGHEDDAQGWQDEKS